MPLAKPPDHHQAKIPNPFPVDLGAKTLPYLSRRGHTSPVTSTVTLAEHFERDGFALQRNASRRINGKKAKCVVLSLAKLKNAGIDWPFDESDGEEP